MFFDGWYPLLRILVVGPCAYVGLVALLRVSGKRTLSKFNAFDLIVTVALGSTLATVILSKDVALADGCLALLLLVGLQLSATWLSVRSPAVSNVIKSTPRLLAYRGEFLDDALRCERVTRGEVLAAAREQGVGQMANVAAVVIETDGTISVVRRGDGLPTTTARDVGGYPPDDATPGAAGRG